MNPTVYHMSRLVHSPRRSSITKLKKILFYQYTRVPPSRCLGFIPRGQKIRENASHLVFLHGKTNQSVYHMSRSVQSPRRSLVSKLKKILFYQYTRVLPSRCLGFFPRLQKIRENAPHVVRLCDNTNQTVYHMSRLVHSPGRSSVTKLKKILFYQYIYQQKHPGEAPGKRQGRWKACKKIEIVVLWHLPPLRSSTPWHTTIHC